MEAKASGKAGASGAAKGGKKATEGTKSLVDKGIEFVKEHPKAILIAGVLGLLILHRHVRRERERGAGDLLHGGGR